MKKLPYIKKPFLFVWSLSLFLLLFFSHASISAETAETSKFMTLGTGTTSGVFYPVGTGICRLLNEDRLEHGYRCLAYPTGAAVNNIQSIETGDLDLGITYENLLEEARRGVGAFDGEAPMRDLHFVTSLYEMPAVILVNKSLSAKKIDDLVGLRINIGNVGSGKRTISETIFSAMHWTPEDFASISELDSTEVQKPFCSGEVDVIVEAMATDSAFFDKMANDCNGRFLNFSNSDIQRIKQVSPGLGTMIIYGGQYESNPEEFQTISMNAVLATSDRVKPDAIYFLTKGIFSNFTKFRALHPTISLRNKNFMSQHEKSIPVHEGAIRYYKEYGFDLQ